MNLGELGLGVFYDMALVQHAVAPALVRQLRVVAAQCLVRHDDQVVRGDLLAHACPLARLPGILQHAHLMKGKYV